MTRPNWGAESQERIGQVFGGKYRIIEELGKGGMGQVYLAEQISLQRHVAIKMVSASDDVAANKRFLLEASLTANLDHPNIVSVHDFGRTEDGNLFLVMERLHGENLKHRIETKGPLSIPDALRMTQQLCGALTQAHQKNVIHRDIKPSNIMLTYPTGAGLTVKLIDFGLVKSVNDEGMGTERGSTQGTPMFMAPEQINHGNVDDRVDVYALGLTVLYAITGQLPYPRTTLPALLQSQLNTSPQSLDRMVEDLSEEHLATWILKTAVHKEPNERFQNAVQMLRSVELCQRYLTTGSFPSLSLDSGVLVSDVEEISEDAAESSPMVRSGSYVAGGEGISDAYARTLTMSGLYDTSDFVFPGFESCAPASKTNLNPMTSSFVGRRDELGQLNKWMNQGEALITIGGIGGTGKTRLAREFGLNYGAENGAEVWFVDCASAMSSDDLVNNVADVLGIQLTSTTPVQQVGNALQARGRVLLIIDNIEQLLPEVTETLVLWSSLAAESRFILTSRLRLGVPEETLLTLEPFSTEDGISLFYARAQEARIDLDTSDTHREVVADIVRRLDGISLAIELAAARCSLMSPKQLLARLSERFQLLQTAAKDKSHRQATLRNAIDWSWRLLKSHEQHTMAQLAVFPSRFTLEAAEAVVVLGEDVAPQLLMDTLQSLQEQSLLRRFTRDDGTVAFGMYQTILDYASEQLVDDLTVVRHRHMAYFTSFCDALNHGDTFDHDVENVRFAFEMAQDLGDAAAGLVLGMALIDRLHRMGPVHLAADTIDELIQIPGIPSLRRASLITMSVLAHRKLKKLSLEETELSWALEQAKQEGDQRLEARCHQVMMQLREGQSQRQQLIDESRAFVKRYEVSSSPECAFEFHYTLAHHLLLQGNIDEVASCLQKAALLQHHPLNKHRRGALAHQWGRYYEHGGRLDKARVHYQRALDIHAQIGGPEQQAMMMGCLANIHRTQGRYDEAKVHYDGALRLYRQWGNVFRAALVLGNKGNFLKEIGEFDAAHLAYQESSAVFDSLGRLTHQAVSYGNQGALLIRMEQFHEAETVLLRCVALCNQIQFKAEGPFLSYLASAYRHQEKWDKASAALDESETLLRETGQVLYVGVMNCERGHVALARKKIGAAKQFLAEAESIAAQLEANPKSDLGHAIAQLKRRIDTYVPWYRSWFQRT